MNTDLIALLNSILDDRELTDKEVFELASWLEAHPETHNEWPATILLEPVRKVVADGRVNKTELARIAKILLKIEAEWSSRLAAKFAEEAAESFDTSIARLPRLVVTVPIESFSSDEIYHVDLDLHTCTCPDWFGTRRQHHIGHLGRCCKHIVKAFMQFEPPGGWPAWLQCLFQDCEHRGRGTHPQEHWAIIRIAEHDVLVSSGEQGWSNVYVPFGGDYERFGYNWQERRWAYGMAPYRSATIARAIHGYFNR